MTKFQANYYQMTYDEAVAWCKDCANDIRADGLDLLTSDYGAAISLLDCCFYRLEMQEWITQEEYPVLNNITTCAYLIENNHKDRASWEKLLELIDSL